MTARKQWLLAPLLLLASENANADTIYNYVGASPVNLTASITFRDGSATSTVADGNYSLPHYWSPPPIDIPPTPYLSGFFFTSHGTGIGGSLGNAIVYANTFTVTAGQITSWNFSFFFGDSVLATSNVGDHVGFRTRSVYGPSFQEYTTTTPGTWTSNVAHVPAPIAGAGLPGLIIASLLWWRRRR